MGRKRTASYKRARRLKNQNRRAALITTPRSREGSSLFQCRVLSAQCVGLFLQRRWSISGCGCVHGSSNYRNTIGRKRCLNSMFKTTCRIYDLRLRPTERAFQNLFHGLKTQHRLNFTLEELRCTPELTAEITPLFEVTFGHFGFKIRGLTPGASRRVNWIWEPHGRLIDFGAFHDGLSEFHGMWMINHLIHTDR